MTRFVIAASLVLAFAGVTQAAPLAPPLDAEFTATTEPTEVLEPPYHACHGRTSGTASAACGTLTGGPSGGLF